MKNDSIGHEMLEIIGLMKDRDGSPYIAVVCKICSATGKKYDGLDDWILDYEYRRASKFKNSCPGRRIVSTKL